LDRFDPLVDPLGLTSAFAVQRIPDSARIVADWPITLRTFPTISRAERVLDNDSVAVGTSEGSRLEQFRHTKSYEAGTAGSKRFLKSESRRFPMVNDDLAVTF